MMKTAALNTIVLSPFFFFTMQIIDFGFSKEVHREDIIATYCGSALYASPEMIQGKAYRGPECDVWSLGVILYCMLTASMPFDDSDWHDFVFSVKRGDYPQPHGISESESCFSELSMHWFSPL